MNGIGYKMVVFTKLLMWKKDLQIRHGQTQFSVHYDLGYPVRSLLQAGEPQLHVPVHVVLNETPLVPVLSAEQDAAVRK